MLKIFRKQYISKVNELYKYIEDNLDDAIMIRNFIAYHEDMLCGMDSNIIKTTGQLDAIFHFYQRDLARTINLLENENLAPKERTELERLLYSDGFLISELSLDGQMVNPKYTEIYINMQLLEKLNNKLPEEDRVDLDALYREKKGKVML